MTGFGAAEYNGDTPSMAVEVRSVNNRYLKVNLRAPDSIHLMESEIEKVVRRSVRRGSLQIQIRREQEDDPNNYQINTAALETYLSQLQPIIENNGLNGRGDALLTQVLALPGVVNEPTASKSQVDGEWPAVEETLNRALEKLVAMRREEGAAMAQELLNYRTTIRGHLDRIQERIPLVADAYRNRLYERVRNVLNEHDVELDRSDLIKEVSIYCERTEIAEEVIRLLSHLDQFQEIMTESESTGRKLDFLTQEMFREANTIGAKSGDVDISRNVVEIKGVLEKIRELVQNIE